MKRLSTAQGIRPRPLFPEHLPMPQMSRIGWTAKERAEAADFLTRLDIATERLEQHMERQVAA